MSAGRHARVEVERRFLVARLPELPAGAEPRTICDRYLHATRLRLRRQLERGGPPVFKLTQKIPGEREQGTITTIRLSAEEHEALSALPGDELHKVRHRLGGPLVVDVFEPPLQGLILAEAEFHSIDEARAYAPPAVCHAEVTGDRRFTGGVLVRAARADVVAWAAEHGVCM